ncbi:MAG: peptidoglycan DD-metalloendopeptidase family protein [Propionibacteriaceae bacterium]|nr:peptidoglycan DD-metalloendopeptidase family protein [Propionibacteriaceae bacterium]
MSTSRRHIPLLLALLTVLSLLFSTTVSAEPAPSGTPLPTAAPTAEPIPSADPMPTAEPSPAEDPARAQDPSRSSQTARPAPSPESGAPEPTGSPAPTAEPTPSVAPEPTPEPGPDGDALAVQARTALEEHAAELGRVRTGAPVSAPVCTAAGVCHRAYQRLTLTWSPTSGVVTHKPSRSAQPRRVFTDVVTTNQFVKEVEWLNAVSISTGYSDGTYRPLHYVERGAMAAFLYRMAGSPSFTPPGEPTFADVPRHHMFYPQIEWLANVRVTTGWVEDHQRWFRPESPIARDAMAAFLYRFAGEPAFRAPATSPFVDVAAQQMFHKEMSWLSHSKLATGWEADGGRAFRPAESIKRDAMAAFLFRAAPLTASTTLRNHGPLPKLPPPPPVYRMHQPAGTNGSPTSPFGWRIHPITKRRTFHNGIDLGDTTGQPIYAAADGIVMFRGWTNGGGNSLYLSHPGLGNVDSRYIHLSGYVVGQGQRVSRGQLIAFMGATGSVTKPHLHFAVKEHGDFVDPTHWIGPISSFYR